MFLFLATLSYTTIVLKGKPARSRAGDVFILLFIFYMIGL